jgi:imidazole glycerol-phosphate synthase subunit HisH
MGMVCIIDYKAGNLTSVKRALDYLSIPSVITDNRDIIRTAERIIFPGVGHARTAIDVLRARGIDEALKEAFNRGIPIMGICLGTQIILAHSDEGDTQCLGLLDGNTPRFSFSDPALKIPHMGWNTIRVEQPHFILKDIREGDEFYFVHSYYPQPANPSQILATCEYGIRFAAAIGHKNLFATQFHPEKSGRLGLAMLKNFIAWDGAGC